MLSKDLFKIATQLKLAYGNFGWLAKINIDGKTEVRSLAASAQQYDHLSILQKYGELLNKENPAYWEAFSAGWVRWYARFKEIGFEGTEEAINQLKNEILALIERFPVNDILIDLVSPKGDFLNSYLIKIDSKAEKAFRQGGITGLKNFYASGSILRKFL